MKKNTQTMRDDPWELMSQKWMDPNFNPTTRAFPYLHPDFRNPIDLSHCKVEKMMITPEKAKDKFYEMKNNMITVKSNWEASGNGCGTPITVDTTVRTIAKDYPEVDGKEPSGEEDGMAVPVDTTVTSIPKDYKQVDANNKRCFLYNFIPVVLYMWEICDKSKILTNVCQELNQDNSYDSMDTTSFISSSHKKKRKKLESPNYSPNMDVQEKNLSTKILIKANELSIEQNELYKKQHELSKQQLNVSMQQNIASIDNNIINCSKLILNCESKLMEYEMKLEDTEEGSRKSEILTKNIQHMQTRLSTLNNKLKELTH